MFDMKVKKVKLPSQRVVLRKVKKKVGFPKCAVCKNPLHGVKRLRRSKLRKLAKTEKRPERPYGGYLCSKCMREIMKERARKIS